MAILSKYILGFLLIGVGGFLDVLVVSHVYSYGATRGDGIAVSLGAAMIALGLAILLTP